MALTKITSNIITDGTIATDDLATATITSISGSGNSSSSSLASRVTVTEASSSNINQDVKSSASPTFAGGTVTGDFTVGGILTAQEFHTEFESASIIYTSGSNKFGDSSDDVHHMSGSLRITGSGDHYFQTGNVGIGTTSPSNIFHSHGLTHRFSSDSYNVVYIQADANNDGSNDDTVLQFTTGNSNTVKGELRYDESDDKFEISAGDNQNHLTIDSSGNSTFAGTVTTTGAVTANGSDYMIKAVNSSTTDGHASRVSAETGTSQGKIEIDFFNDSTRSAGGYGLIQVGKTSNAPQLGILASGGVGIGTNNPSNQLHIFSSAGGVDTILKIECDASNASPSLLLDAATDRDSGIQFRENNSLKAQIYNDASNDALVLTDGANSNLMHLKGGSVGIGTTTPSEKLEVYDGDILVSSGRGVRANGGQEMIRFNSSNGVQVNSGNAERVRFKTDGSIMHNGTGTNVGMELYKHTSGSSANLLFTVLLNNASSLYHLTVCEIIIAHIGNANPRLISHYIWEIENHNSFASDRPSVQTPINLGGDDQSITVNNPSADTATFQINGQGSSTTNIGAYFRVVSGVTGVSSLS